MSGGWATRVRADVRPYVKPLRMGPGAIVPNVVQPSAASARAHVSSGRVVWALVYCQPWSMA